MSPPNQAHPPDWQCAQALNCETKPFEVIRAFVTDELATDFVVGLLLFLEKNDAAPAASKQGR